MCQGCFAQYNNPTPSPEALALAPLLASLFPNGGGGAHIVVEDWNLEDSNILWCMNEWEEITPHEKGVLGKLLLLSEPQRAAALAWAEGWYPEQQESR